VVLITVDTLRADHTEPYDPDSGSTPAIARLAKEGTLFEAAMSPMQMTRPSHYSLFTSLYPRDHGVVNNKISLQPDFPNLAETFRDHGYDTAAFVGVSLLGPGSGAERGFDRFSFPTSARTRPARKVVTSALSWLNQRSKEKPFFLWIHLFDPHTPYAPPARFSPKPDNAIARAMVRVSIEQLIAIEAEHGGNLPRSAFERAVALYQGDVAFADHWIGKLIDRLEDSNELDQTAVVLTADHGECFENGIFFEHSDCLYEGAARIPLIFRYPDRVKMDERRGEVVEILDVAPTLLALADLPAPDTFLGRNLFDEADTARGSAFLQHPLYSNIGAETRKVRKLSRVMGRPVQQIVVSEEMLGIRTREWKYLRHGEHEELYHLPSDPRESRNVASENPEVTRELQGKLEVWSADHPQHHADVGMINDELRATLEALGYLH
jgi:choline-sulfatase